MTERATPTSGPRTLDERLDVQPGPITDHAQGSNQRSPEWLPEGRSVPGLRTIACLEGIPTFDLTIVVAIRWWWSGRTTAWETGTFMTYSVTRLSHSR